MKCRERLEAYLQENSVPYQIQHHPVAYTAQRVADSEHLPGRLLGKVVVVSADGKLAMLVLPAPARVDWGRVAVALGTDEVRLAHESEFARTFPDCEVGAMPPFGNLYDLPVYVDEEIARLETAYFQAGSHLETFSLRYSDFDRLVKPRVAALAATPPPKEALAHN
jgi:Ala-tRNA(Pro) deacylase